MAKPTQPRKTARDERAHRNRLLPPAGGSPRVEVSDQQEPEPYFVVGGRERHGYRNAIAAIRAAHPEATALVRMTGDIECFGPIGSGLYPAQRYPRKGRHARVGARG